MTEAELLFTDILNCKRPDLYFNRNLRLGREKASLISSVFKRRISGEPLSYILGKAEFMGLEFKVNKDVLIPRPETEILVETVIKQVTRSPGHQVTRLNILDIGTGSGCIAISLAKFLPDAKITATDISLPALKIAQENANLNNVKVDFVHSDLFNTHNSQLTTHNLIISNPPYIPTAEIGNLQPEIQYEPRIALDGGKDGLDFYRRVIRESTPCLEEGGFLILEMGFGQAEAIKNIFHTAENFKIIEIVKDYNNIERVVVARRKWIN